MKISKVLLGAILAGITVQTTVTSCSKKEQSHIKPGTDTQAKEQVKPPSPNPNANPTPNPNGEPCPGCGMG